MEKQSSKLNCWEFKKCGREPGGVNVAKEGVCQAAIETRANGIHGGNNGGRACWVVAGTLCLGEIQGTYAKKLKNCIECEFYQKVLYEEERFFLSGKSIMERIDNNTQPEDTLDFNTVE